MFIQASNVMSAVISNEVSSGILTKSSKPSNSNALPNFPPDNVPSLLFVVSSNEYDPIPSSNFQ